MFKTVVVGIDGSEASEKALRTACDVAGKYGAEIHLVHTPQPQTVAFATGAIAGYHAVTMMPSPQEVEAATEKVIQGGIDIAKSCGQTITQSHTAVGHPADEIIACADGCGADLIVTGRRGLGNFGALLLGSTSLEISHNAKCAVLTVA